MGTKLFCVLLFVLSTTAKPYEDRQEETISLTQDETKHIRPRVFQNPQGGGGGYRPSNIASFNNNDDDSDFAPAQQIKRPLYAQELEQYQNSIPIQQKPALPKKQQLTKQQIKELEDEEEKEEPDRLSQLLPNSHFDCVGRKTGYYADEELQCEVFHYCQDDTKHSWICPDGFTFHQVHLICMPPSHDNICTKSSQYHFVNDYLYKPVNAEEVQRKPNVSLKYSDRFYPAEVYQDGRFDDDEEEEQERHQPAIHQAPVQRRPVLRPAPALQAIPSPITIRRPQVFRNAEEVDIPLVQRRPSIPQPFHPSNNQEFDFE